MTCSRSLHSHRFLELVGVVSLLVFSGEAVAADRVLTDDHRFKRDPVFLDARTLVYVVQARPEQLQLVKRNLVDGTEQPIHKDETRSELEPAFSRDGRFVAYLQSRSAASVGMVIDDTREDVQAEIPPASGFSGMRSPAFTPDGRRVLYAFAEGGRQKIFSCNTAGKDRKLLVDGAGLCNWPSVSADGRMLLFGSTRDGNYEIYVAAADGSAVHRLTHHRGQDVRPRLSPDGKRIVFVSNRDGNREIYLMNVDGSGISRITKSRERDDFPAWHPDGKRIVFVGERCGRFDLRLLDVP
jgi:Tol biopolymer transport system component